MHSAGRLAVPLALAVAAYAWWAVARPPFSTGAAAAVVGAGLAAMTAGARHRRRASEAKPGVAAWVALAVVAAAWQLASYLQSPREEHPTVSSLTNGVLDSHPARAAAFVVWLLAARELARR